MYEPHSANDHSAHDHYVSKAGWVVPAGRDDLIDEVADQYERAVCAACVPQELYRAS